MPKDCLLEVPGIVRQPICSHSATSHLQHPLAGELLKQAEEFACLAFLKSFLSEPECAGKQTCSYAGT